MSNQIIKYQTDKGEVKISPQIVKRYLVSGDADRVTDQEVVMFINLCKYQKLNPFLREAYLIKFGNNPATIVTGKDAFTKRAASSENCKGWEAGIIVRNKDGKIEQRTGTFKAPDEELLGGWAKVYRTDWSVPLENTVSLDEYQRYNSKGQLMRNWREMPATMIRKVALVQALREAMPAEFQGLYSPEEMPVDDSTLNAEPVTVEEQYRQNGKGTNGNDDKARKAFFAKLNDFADDRGYDHDFVKEKAKEALRDAYNIDSCSKLQPTDWDKIVKNFDRFLATLEEKYLNVTDISEEDIEAIADEIDLPDDSEVLQSAE